MSKTMNRSTVRQYLLGQLDASGEMESRVSAEIFLDEDSSEMIDAIEDEIIEAYVEGTLDPTETKAVEDYFLRSPDHQAKLRFYRALQLHLEKPAETDPADVPLADSESIRLRPGGFSGWPWKVRALLYGQAFALLLLGIVGWRYAAKVRTEQATLEGALAQERNGVASLQASLTQLQKPISVLTLVSDRSRATETAVPTIEITSSTQRIFVEIALAKASRGAYKVQLEARHGTEPLWEAKLLPLFSPSGDARMVFDLPAQVVQPGAYSLLVSSDASASPARWYYDFVVDSAKP